MIDSNSAAVLQNFLKLRGLSLAPYGSAEFALCRSDAILFFDLLEHARGQALGIEVWKRVGMDLAIDSLGGWYSDAVGRAENIESAREFIRDSLVSDEDLFTIQFD